MTGLEPATLGITIRCSNQLSYNHRIRNNRDRRGGEPKKKASPGRRQLESYKGSGPSDSTKNSWKAALMGLFVAKFRKTLKASAGALIVLFVVPKDFNQSAGPSAANQAAIAFRDEFDFYQGLVLIGDAQNSIAPHGLRHTPLPSTEETDWQSGDLCEVLR